MTEETQDQTPEEGKPAEEAKRKTARRPPAVPVNKSFRFAIQRNEQRLDESSDVTKIEEELEKGK